MKKLNFAIVLLLLTVFTLSAVREVRGETNLSKERMLPRLVDNADVLNADEEKMLLDKLDRISESYQVDVVIHTTQNAKYNTIEQYADDYYDYNGFGFGEQGHKSGFVLVMDYGRRKWHISTAGEGIFILSNEIRPNMTDAFMPYLSNGEAYKGFDTFADLSEEIIKAYQEEREPNIIKNADLPEGRHTDHDATGGENYQGPKKDKTFVRALIGIGLGLLVALIVVASLTGQLNTVRAVHDAADYEVAGSFMLNESNDFFLYRTVSKTKKSSSSSSGGGSHSSSSGSSHGGGGGSF